MMPVIFVGHGNPMYAIEENSFTRTWQNLGQILPKPQAIVVISAHWETVGTYVTAMERPRTIHDFYGFPQPLFDVQYNAVGSPKLANEIAERLKKTNVQADENWGLDHGTWSVLRHIYPDANVPIVQLSLDRTKSASEHYELAEELQFLRNNGVLIIGSGNIVHNLRLVNFRNKSGDDWAISANETLKTLILSGNHESLINYQTLGSNVRLAIPTAEHYLPLLYVLALKNNGETVEVFNDAVELGSLSMTSFKIG
jgi:4,5-DOPA dioxygenase extradiol